MITFTIFIAFTFTKKPRLLPKFTVTADFKTKGFKIIKSKQRDKTKSFKTMTTLTMFIVFTFTKKPRSLPKFTVTADFKTESFKVIKSKQKNKTVSRPRLY